MVSKEQSIELNIRQCREQRDLLNGFIVCILLLLN